MGRKCSHCGNFGHNSRTCTNFRGNTNSGFRLFGVQLHHDNFMMSTSSSTSHHINSLKVAAMSMKKSFSMDCLPTSSSSSSPSSSRISIDESVSAHDKASIGYLSDGLICRAQERKKGVPWTEEEHRKFLIGLEKLGKGDWRGISRNYVTSRTPTQVASHAQKYFLRQATLNKKKRRSSLFDMFGSNNDVDVPLSDALPPQHNNNSTRDISDRATQLPVLELGTSSSQMSLKSSDIRKPDVPGWIFGLIDSQMKYSSSNAASKHGDDLELTLAVPMNSNLEPKNKSSSPNQQGGPLLNLGSISVT